MTGPHQHGSVPALVTAIPVVLLAVASGGYLVAVVRHRQRGAGRDWPLWRTALWLLGLATAGTVLLGLPGTGFRGHMVGHVLLGMLAPLLLVCGAPVTLALRALPVQRARVLARMLRSTPVALLTHPVPTALLSVGGLWLLYRTGLHAESMRSPLLLLVVQAHVLVAGYLFTAALVAPDPMPHRARLGVRAAVLVAAVAAHNVLAKVLVAAPPAGVPAADGLAGGQLMYYLGAPVEIALFVLLGAQWAARDSRVRVPAGHAAVRGQLGRDPALHARRR